MKLGVCVPYRNREEHLKKFIPAIHKYLTRKGIEYGIYFGHQVDDKLFNRGAMKNIAAKFAFEDGCDYIVWHDIDMLPVSVDYSHPEENPIHVATQISQMDYKLKYPEYFGGAVLFTKEQVEKTNGYSNNYWDWGMEDDDLFWRCKLEGYLNETHIDFEEEREYLHFNGTDSYIQIPCTRQLRSLTAKNHTISVLVRAQQQQEKVPVWLVGDIERRFCEYPIFRRPGWDYGLSYNNSRAYTSQIWNNKGEHIYQWIKRYENQWSWITVKVEDNKIHFYLNGEESDARWGMGTNSPMEFDGRLKRYGKEDYYLGTTTSVPNTDPSKYFKGDIADVRCWNRSLSDIEIRDIHKEVNDDGLIIHYTFKDGLVNDLSYNGNDGVVFNTELRKDNIFIPNTSIPHRREGRMFCLPHEDEGMKIVDGVHKWTKKPTSENEKKYILEMQQGKSNYKNDGIKQVEYKLIGVDNLQSNVKMINVEL